jgi:hypothetical protein
LTDRAARIALLIDNATQTSCNQAVLYVIISTYRRGGVMAWFSRNGETSSMIIIDALLIVALLFFLFLPITDRKTVRMKLAVVCAIAAVLVVSVTRTPPGDLQIASVARDR